LLVLISKNVFFLYCITVVAIVESNQIESSITQNNKVWLGLPDPEKCQGPKEFAAALAAMNECVLNGFFKLPHSEQRAFVDHCRDRGNWAARRQSSKKKTSSGGTTKEEGVAPEGAASSTVPSSSAASSTTTTTTTTTNATAALVPSSSSNSSNSQAFLVAGRQKFVMPRPGANGASGVAVFEGQTFVMTGVFPEVGGGAGLSLGKDRVKKMIQSFGDHVTSSVSGKTNVLIVGKNPGMSKVTQAGR
jgi:NAD-dependent DNA ligase